MLRQDAERLQQDIASLYLQFPELKDDDEILRVDTLEGATNLKELLSAILSAIDQAKDLRDGAKRRIEEVRARGKRYDMRVDFLRAMIVKILAHADVRKIELPEATLGMKAGQPRVLGQVDPDTLPDDLCRIVREPNLTAIKQRLQEGSIVEGYVLSNAEPVLGIYP